MGTAVSPVQFRRLVQSAAGSFQHGGRRTLSADDPPSMPETPRISVITATLNSAATLENCLRSVATQTYPNVEHVIVDGVSKDRTVELLRAQGSQIEYWCSEKDGGIYEAFNKGASLASGDFLLYLGSDDALLPDALSVLVEGWRSSRASLVYGDLLVDRGDGEAPTLQAGVDDPLRKLPFEMPTGHMAMLCARPLFERHGGFDTSFRIAGDLELIARFVIQGKATTSHVHKPIAVFSMGGFSSVRSSYLRARREDLRIALRHQGGFLASHLVHCKRLAIPYLTYWAILVCPPARGLLRRIRPHATALDWVKTKA